MHDTMYWDTWFILLLIFDKQQSLSYINNETRNFFFFIIPLRKNEVYTNGIKPRYTIDVYNMLISMFKYIFRSIMPTNQNCGVDTRIYFKSQHKYPLPPR